MLKIVYVYSWLQFFTADNWLKISVDIIPQTISVHIYLSSITTAVRLPRCPVFWAKTFSCIVIPGPHSIRSPDVSSNSDGCLCAPIFNKCTMALAILVKITLRSAARPRRALAGHSEGTLASSGALKSHLNFTSLRASHLFRSHSHIFHLWVTWSAKCLVNASWLIYQWLEARFRPISLIEDLFKTLRGHVLWFVEIYWNLWYKVQ